MDTTNLRYGAARSVSPTGLRFSCYKSRLRVHCCGGKSDRGVLEDTNRGEKLIGGDVFSVTSSSKSDIDYLGESTKGDLNVKKEHLGSLGELRFW